MRKQIISFLSAVLLFSSVYGQKPEDILNQWAVKSPVEKAYLQFDRENYIAGETAWFKAYMTADFSPDTISSTLYVELVNDASVVIDRKIVPVFWGAARGQLELPDTLTTGSYTIRAYTATMLNHAADFIFRRSIFIYGKKNSVAINAAVINKTRLEFFPEGGNLINGLLNAVAFKATNNQGLPAEVSGTLYNDQNKLLASFSSYHDGLGMFEFTPAAGEKYYVQFGNTTADKFYLPNATDNGIVMAIVTNSKQLSFEIQQAVTDPLTQAAYIVGQMQHHIVFRQSLPAGKQAMNGIINTQKLNSGILQITAFNSDGLPLAERLCFIDNKEYILQGTVITDTINFSAKAKNHFSISIPDTVNGNFSVAITDPAYDVVAQRESNIFSSLLLTSDVKGYIHNPSWYFTANPDSARRAMDLVMMTNGWRRFNWMDLTKNTIPKNNYKDLSYITLSGKATMLDSKKVFGEKDLLITMNNPDSTSTMQVVTTDKQGNFKLDSMFFWGRNRLLFSDPRGNKSQLIEIKMSGDSLARIFPLQPEETIPYAVSDTLLTAKQEKLAMDYDVIQKASGLMLEGITVSSKRKKTPVQELEEKYTTGLFNGPSDHIIDLVNTKEPLVQRNIFEYLQSRVPGITVTTSSDPLSSDYTLYYRGGRTMSLQGPIPMILYLNELRVDANILAGISPSDISMVKVYSNFVGAEHNGAGGVLSVYTKKGDDYAAAQHSNVYQLYYKGYSVRKEFYSPDYAVDVSDKYKTDNRITLHWQPDIFVNSSNPKLPVIFYNNDRTKQFKIVVEGMTTSGKMLMIEKIISAKAF